MMSVIFSLLCVLLSLVLQSCESTTILVDGVSQWNNPSVYVGDTVIFKHKYEYNLYIFQNQKAFNLCNFTQATLLTKNNSAYTWHPSRAGFFYFTFRNESLKSTTCQMGSQKLAIKVSTLSPPVAEAEPPVAVGSTPAPGYPWPFRPKQTSPSSPPPVIMATVMPDKGGGGIPFINSNPAVPLPTGEVDSATITPLNVSSAMATKQVVDVMGHFGVGIIMFLLWLC